MKIIKHGDFMSKIKHFTCTCCGCVFTANAAEYTRVGDIDVGTCPTCRNAVIFKEKKSERSAKGDNINGIMDMDAEIRNKIRQVMPALTMNDNQLYLGEEKVDLNTGYLTKVNMENDGGYIKLRYEGFKRLGKIADYEMGGEQ